MKASIRVAVVDDHQLFRDGVVEILATLPEVEVVAQGGSSADAVRIAADVRPDVILLDLDMPDTRTTRRSEATQRILDVSPSTCIIILTMHDEAHLVRELLLAGAGGYLLKSAGRDELLSAVKAAANNADSGTVNLSRGAALALSSQTPRHTSLLTERELEVLQLVAGGGSNRDIARDLHVAEATVKRHLATIFTKLDATSRISAVNAARRLGLMPHQDARG